MSKLTFINFSFHMAGFTTDDIGKVIQMKVGWRIRAWYWIKRYLLRHKIDPPGLFVITEVKNCTWVEIEPAYFCYQCKRVVPWSFGCADELPHVCDDCYVRQCPICKAKPGQACDGGFHG